MGGEYRPGIITSYINCDEPFESKNVIELGCVFIRAVLLCTRTWLLMWSTIDVG